MKPVAISQLRLNNFRNYPSRVFDFPTQITAISGLNGIGKTNILEAISLFNKGSGLKNAEFDEMIASGSDVDNFTLYAKINHHPDIENIGTSYLKPQKKKIFQINGQINSGVGNVKIFPAIIWLTPQMDALFSSSKTLRRKFLDKIVSDIDINHNTRLNNYNHSLRERLNLLNRFGNKQQNWLIIVEREIAELGTAIASARNEAINYLNHAILQASEHFTKAHIQIIGELEELALHEKALVVEEKFIEKLRANRELDVKSGRTNFGVHRSDFTAILINKGIEARLCSTGEQKSILIAITFARIKIFSLLNLPSAILLLDEIISHLDEKKRSYLLAEVTRLNCQSFLTATSQNFFSDLYHFDKNLSSFLALK